MTPTFPRQWVMPEESEQGLVASGDANSDLSEQETETEAGDDGHLRMKIDFDRRAHRRFDVENWGVSMERWDGRRDSPLVFGKVMDLAVGGVRLRTRQANVRVDQQIRVRLELPNHGGISPFIDLSSGQARPAKEWVGWLAVSRVNEIGEGMFDIAGKLVDMQAMDQGMLGLYLSTQPLAA